MCHLIGWKVAVGVCRYTFLEKDYFCRAQSLAFIIIINWHFLLSFSIFILFASEMHARTVSSLNFTQIRRTLLARSSRLSIVTITFQLYFIVRSEAHTHTHTHAAARWRTIFSLLDVVHLTAFNEQWIRRQRSFRRKVYASLFRHQLWPQNGVRERKHKKFNYSYNSWATSNNKVGRWFFDYLILVDVPW